MRSPWARPVTLSRLDAALPRQRVMAPLSVDAPPQLAKLSASSASSRCSWPSVSSSRPSFCSFISGHQGTSLMILKIMQVSVTMQTLSFKDVTCVEFGILPDQINTSISAQSMRTLRTKLMQLTLQQMNLSLTPSVFGDPFCVEVLGFPGGITMEVELPPYNSNVYFVQPIFNVTLEMSIHQIRGVLAELKKSLEHTLGQALHKGICLDVTNKNGSTINPPVTVQVSLSPDDRNIYEEPQRLKQLAEIIIESSSRNLGLNPSIFGRIKDLELDPYLQSIIPSFAPSSSPTPIPSPSMPPYSQPSNLCEHCSCPDFVTIMNTAFPHRKLMRLPPMAILLQLPTRLHSGKIPLHEKNGNAVATPTFIATSSRP